MNISGGRPPLALRHEPHHCAAACSYRVRFGLTLGLVWNLDPNTSLFTHQTPHHPGAHTRQPRSGTQKLKTGPAVPGRQVVSAVWLQVCSAVPRHKRRSSLSCLSACQACHPPPNQEGPQRPPPNLACLPGLSRPPRRRIQEVGTLARAVSHRWILHPCGAAKRHCTLISFGAAALPLPF